MCNLTVDNRVRQRLAEIEGPEALSMSAKRLEDAARGRFPPYDDMRGVMTTAFVAEYNRQAGLRVGIDALANLPDHGVVSKGYLTKVRCCPFFIVERRLTTMLCDCTGHLFPGASRAVLPPTAIDGGCPVYEIH